MNDLRWWHHHEQTISLVLWCSSSCCLTGCTADASSPLSPHISSPVQLTWGHWKDHLLISRTLNSSLSSKVPAPNPAGVLCSVMEPTPDTLLAGSLTKPMVWMQPSEVLGIWRLAQARLSLGRSNAIHYTRLISRILNCNLKQFPGFQLHRFYRAPIFPRVRQHISSKQEVFFLPSKF